MGYFFFISMENLSLIYSTYSRYLELQDIQQSFGIVQSQTVCNTVLCLLLFLITGQLENQNVGEQQPPSSEARTMPATVSALLGESSPVNVVRGPPPPKRHKISEEVRDQRKFVCQLCGNKFKEVILVNIKSLPESISLLPTRPLPVSTSAQSDINDHGWLIV